MLSQACKCYGNRVGIILTLLVYYMALHGVISTRQAVYKIVYAFMPSWNIQLLCLILMLLIYWKLSLWQKSMLYVISAPHESSAGSWSCPGTNCGIDNTGLWRLQVTFKKSLRGPPQQCCNCIWNGNAVRAVLQYPFRHGAIVFCSSVMLARRLMAYHNILFRIFLESYNSLWSMWWLFFIWFIFDSFVID